MVDQFLYISNSNWQGKHPHFAFSVISNRKSLIGSLNVLYSFNAVAQDSGSVSS